MPDALSLLVRDAFGDEARILERRPAVYRSSLAVDEVTVRTGDGRRHRLAAKNVAPDQREITAYREVLARLRLATPVFVAARDGLLLLEWVDGAPLWQSGDLADWEAAARWLAGLHSSPIASWSRRLPRHDEARLRRRASGASLAPGVEAAIARLAAVPALLIHGEFYPANVLVDDGRIRPLDWETFGLGPAVLDLAALTAGTWAGDEPARIEAAYCAALPAGRQPTPQALADARLIIDLECGAAA